jgi:integrase
MALIGVLTGLRVGEILGLRWQDVDFKQGELRVEQAVYRGSVGSPKTQGSRRTLAELAYFPADARHPVAAGGRIAERCAGAQLGHAQMSTTLGIYTLPVPAHQRAAVEKLSGMVTNGDKFGSSSEGSTREVVTLQCVEWWAL